MSPVQFAVVIGLFGCLMGVYMGWVLWGRDKQFKPKQPAPDESEILVKRVRPSFRHPGKTSTSSYDSYKQSNGLYATVRQGKGNTADEVNKK